MVLLIIGAVLLVLFYLVVHASVFFILGVLAIVLGLIALACAYAGHPIGGRRW